MSTCIKKDRKRSRPETQDDVKAPAEETEEAKAVAKRNKTEASAAAAAAEPRKQDAYRIYIDGACKNNNRPIEERYAGYGIYVDRLTDAEPQPFDLVDNDVDSQLNANNNTNNTSAATVAADANALRSVSETCVCSGPTNNRAELMAAIRCLELLVDGRFGATRDSRVTIVNDSKLVYDSVTDFLPRIWRPNNYRRENGAPVANGDLVRRLDAAVLNAQRSGWRNVHWQHMNSHRQQPKDRSSNEWCDWFGNDQADRLANLACKRAKLQRKKKNKCA